jgi:hypothetical protein
MNLNKIVLIAGLATSMSLVFASNSTHANIDNQIASITPPAATAQTTPHHAVKAALKAHNAMNLAKKAKKHAKKAKKHAKKAAHFASKAADHAKKAAHHSSEAVEHSGAAKKHAEKALKNSVKSLQPPHQS